MTRVVKSSAVVVTSLWVGALFCLGFVVAPYLFVLATKGNPNVPDSGVAADLIGPLLYGSDVASLATAGVLVAALAYLRRRGEVPLGGRLFLCETAVLVAATCSAVNYWWVAPRVKAVQQQLAARYGAFNRADKADPLVAQFNGLHSTSTTVFVLGLAAALACLVCMTHFRSRHPAPGYRQDGFNGA